MLNAAQTAAKETVKLKIDGQSFEGWTEVSITRSMESLCAAFRLGLFDHAPGQTDRSVIKDGAACQIYVGDVLFLTGYIDDIEEEMSSTSHSISVSGRDKTADLVDCSAEVSPGSWKNQRLEVIARKLLKPFGISLRVDASTGAAFALFAIEPGEKVFAALTRMCRMRGVMLRTDIDGTLVIYTPSETAAIATFEHGVNCKTFKLKRSMANRFSQYIIKGHHRGGNVSAKDTAGPKGTATDPNVNRYRPLVIISDEQSTASGLKARAAWEATTRVGKTQDIAVTVPGWHYGDTLYAPRDYARVVSSYYGLDSVLMIATIEFSLSGSGTQTAISLRSPLAFGTKAILEAKKKKGKKGTGDQWWTTWEED